MVCLFCHVNLAKFIGHENGILGGEEPAKEFPAVAGGRYHL